MKKLRLEELHVESFTTTAQAVARGTVMGHGTEGGDSCIIQCATMAGMGSCVPAECGTSFDPNCETGGPSNLCTRYAVTCGEAGSCAPGATMCGTCYGEATCDLQYGCGGTTQGPQIC